MSKNLKYHIPVLIFCCAIFVESSVPTKKYPEIEFELIDKIVHFGIFLVFFFSVFYSFSNQEKFYVLKKNPIVFSLVFSALYGAFDELHQYFVPGRSCDIYDWTADVLGSVFAALLLLFYKKLFIDKKNKPINTSYDTIK